MSTRAAESARRNGRRGGRPKGSRGKATVARDAAKEVAREFTRQRITAQLGPIVDAAIKRALGLSYLVTRDAGSGKFIRVTRQTLAKITTVIEVWEKEPDIQAVRELLDRALDRAKEQALDVHLTTTMEEQLKRLDAGRARNAAAQRLSPPAAMDTPVPAII